MLNPSVSILYSAVYWFLVAMSVYENVLCVRNIPLIIEPMGFSISGKLHKSLRMLL